MPKIIRIPVANRPNPLHRAPNTGGLLNANNQPTAKLAPAIIHTGGRKPVSTQ